jgi:hypothetical protein
MLIFTNKSPEYIRVQSSREVLVEVIKPDERFVEPDPIVDERPQPLIATRHNELAFAQRWATANSVRGSTAFPRRGVTEHEHQPATTIACVLQSSRELAVVVSSDVRPVGITAGVSGNRCVNPENPEILDLTGPRRDSRRR